MKRTIMLLAIISCSFRINAQFNVTLNGKKVTVGEKFNYADLKTLNISFSNPEKLPPNIKGDLNFDIRIIDKNQKLLSRLTKSINGFAAVSVFLYPKTSKEYVLMPNKTPFDFEANSSPYGQFIDVCNQLKINPNADQVTIDISLQFFQLNYDSNGNQYYEKPIDVVEKFNFTLNIADLKSTITCNSINAKFKLSDMANIGFVNIDSSGKWNKIKNFPESGNNSPTDISFIFEGTRIQIANLIYSNTKTSTENLAEFKTLCDRTSYTQANLCNRNLDEKELLKLVDIGLASFFNFYNNSIVEKFDKKNNKNAESETLWESFKLNNVSGFKAVNTLKTNICSPRKPLYGGYGPADPSARKLNGSSVVYVIINPLNPKSLLVFSYIQTEGDFNENLAKEKSIFMEKFISVLNFSK